MSSTTTLAALERRAHGAPAQELRLLVNELLTLREPLSGDEREHADALLLKLEHLAVQQAVPSASPTDVAVYLAPELQIEPGAAAVGSKALAVAPCPSGGSLQHQRVPSPT